MAGNRITRAPGDFDGRANYLSITLDEDGRAKVVAVGNVPERLEFEQIRPAFDWAIANLDAETAASL